MAAKTQFGPKLGCLIASFLAVCTATPAVGGHSAPQAVPASSPAGGETVVAMTGTVKTSEGAAIPSATVRLTNTDSNKSWVSWTDESGKFDFPSLPAGHYHIEASQLGFIKTASDAQLPAPADKPVAIVLRVATLAELNAPQAGGGRGRPGSGNSAGATGPGRRQFGGNPGNAPGRFGPGGQSRDGAGGRGQLPAGIANAMNQGMAGGGFAPTDLTGEGSGTGAGEETVGPAGAEVQANAELSSGTASSTSSDSFLLQGTTGQGLATNPPGGPAGPGGPGGFGPEGLAPAAPGGPQGFGSAGGRAAFAGGGFGGPGGPGGLGGPGGPGARLDQGGIFGRRGGGAGGGGGRLARQAVNRVRFSFYDRYTNSAFDARPYSITGNEFPKISNHDERFGANMGGPLKIPHLYDGSRKTSFFANFQGEAQKAGVDTFSTVPTLAERSGNFCGLGITLYNPFSSLAGPRTALGNGCQIPAINPASEALLSYYPLPNVPGQTAQNYVLQATTPQNTEGFNIHLLHTINAKFNLNIGYNFSSSRQDTLGAFPDIRGRTTTRGQNVDWGLTHNWSPKFLENTHLNWTRSRSQTRSSNSFVDNISGNLGITGIATDPLDYGLPGVQFSSFTGFSDPVPALVRNQTLRFSDAVTWIHTKHTLTFGGEIRRIELNSDSNPNPRGLFRFTGVMTTQLTATGRTAVPLTPLTEPYYEFADFLLGLPYNTSVQFGAPNTYLRSWGFIGYAQDDFRVNKRFTFQYGVRYQSQTPPVELYNHLANLDLNSSATAVAVVTPGESGPFSGAYPRALLHGDYNQWAPRVGFAWDPGIKPRTIVRSGYSIFYNQSVYNTLAQKYLAYQPPFDQSENLYTSATQVLTLQQGFPSQADSNKILNTAGVSLDYRPAYAQIWMLGTETSFTQNWLLDLTYTGTKGTRLDLLRAPNRAPLGTSQLDTQTELQIPYATSFYYDQTGANSIYNALQVRVVHRFTRGVSFSGIYTYSKSLDNASSIGGSGGIVVQQDGNYAAERGLSSFDMRHQFHFTSTYELPFGERNRWANRGWEEKAFGNLRLLNNITWHTGTPLTAYLGGSAANNSGTGSNFSERADQIGNPNFGICGGSSLGFFRAAAFATPAAGEYGDEHRGAIEGPCQFSWNLSIAKSVRFGPEQRHTLNASWEIQNLTNTPAFSGVGTTLGSTTFGRITGAGSMRSMDIMIRFNL
jgi:hypothetical protein